MRPPLADLTQHVTAHTEGELWWWITNGVAGTSSNGGPRHNASAASRARAAASASPARSAARPCAAKVVNRPESMSSEAARNR